MARDYIQNSVFELEGIFEASKTDIVVLKALAKELKARKVPRAVLLAKKVREALEGLEGNPASKNSSDKAPPSAPVIKCEVCGTKLRLRLTNELADYTCPQCKTLFTASFNEGILSVVFSKVSGPEDRPKRDDQFQISVEDAYSLFEADQSTPWEILEKTRRRLIQQYHPDKVAALGPKLRALAEVEGKRINIAFDLLRKSRGL